MEAKVRFFSRENLFAFAFLVILVALLVLAITILDPFLGDFFWALILSLTFYPLFRRLRKWLKGRANLASFILTAAILIALLLPGFFVLMNLGKEVKAAYQAFSAISWVEKGRSLTETLHSPRLEAFLQKFGVEPEQVETILRNSISNGLESIPRILGEKVSMVFRNLALFIMHALFVSVALFFFFRDGARYAQLLVELLPLEQTHRNAVVDTFSTTITAVVRGTFITSLVQGLLAGAGCAVAGLPVPILLGLVTSITSMIPFLGATSVWLPASIWLFLQGETLPGLGLALFGACIISTVDNIIKPLIIGEGTKLPVFLLFFTILGGLNVYGVLGVFLGPIILAMGMAFISIYKEIYLNPAKEKKSAAAGQEPAFVTQKVGEPRP